MSARSFTWYGFGAFEDSVEVIMTLRRAFTILFSATFVSMWVVCAYTYSTLPESIPMHFDAAGTPDQFAPRSLATWFSLPLVFTVLTGLFAAMAFFIPRVGARYPTYVNVPEKQTFVRLSPEAREKALSPMVELSLMLGPALHALSMYIQWGSAGVARGEGTTLSILPVVFVLLYALGSLFVSIVRMRDAVKSAAA